MKRSLVIIVIVLLCACKKDKPEPVTPEVPVAPQPDHQKVFVINEGKFGDGNASVSLYNASTAEVVQDHYKAQNGSAIGDVVQSMARINGKYYIVVNNSKKIVVCDNELKKIAEIGNLPSPRYIVPVNETKAYVSDLAANRIHIIDLSSATVSGSIACSGWSERMIVHKGEVFVANQTNGKLYVINPSTDKIVDSLAVGAYPGGLGLDANGSLWVLSQGDAFNNIDGKLLRVDAAARKVEQSLAFTAGSFPSALCFNKGKDTLLYLNNGVWRMPVSATALPGEAFIAAGTKMFYGLGVNPADHTIYVSDALDFIQSSTIYIYDTGGNNKSFFKAGINSNSFYFEEK